MKVLALGGSGGMWRFAVETSMNFDKVSEIIVGDINADAAIAFADSMNNKVSGIVIGRSLTKGNIRDNIQKLINHLDEW